MRPTRPLTTVGLDLDITPSRRADNVERVAAALDALEARLRGSREEAVPIKPQFLRDVESWALETRYGDLNLVFAPAGTAGFDVRRDAVDVDLGDGLVVPMASLRDVIRMKEAAGREQDQAQLPAPRRTLELVRQRGD